jgi:quercetin dioxygenase-like cupin family protein
MVTLTNECELLRETQHAGTEFIYVLSGAFRYRVGATIFPLEPGDALTVQGDVLHGPTRLDSTPVRMLSVIIRVNC